MDLILHPGYIQKAGLPIFETYGATGATNSQALRFPVCFL